jgi:hypothetical protein
MPLQICTLIFINIGVFFVCYTLAMLKTKKIPHILFIIGIILIGFYGLILSIIAIFIQIFIILGYWKNNPAQKQRTKFTLGIILFTVALIIFGLSLHQLHSYFGGIGIIMWLIIGAIPFAVSSFALLTIPTTTKARK